MLTLDTIDPLKAYDTAAISELCGVSRGTVLRWIGEGKLKALPSFGQHKRFRGADILAALRPEPVVEKPQAKPKRRNPEAELRRLEEMR